MTTFVRRIPAEFDETYWRASSRYMERELGAVPEKEAQRHENPSGFADTAGQVSGQRKDMSYCFAPYDGLRGLGMPDVHEYDSVGALPAGIAPIKVNLDLISDPKRQKEALRAMREESEFKDTWKKALPYVAVGGGVLALLLLMRK